MTVETAAPAHQRLALTVVLEVKHRVSVQVDTTSDKSVDELRDLAMKKYTDLNREWQKQFRNRTDVEVHGEDVKIGELRTRTPSEPRSW